MISILVTGANGQLGNEFRELAKTTNFNWIFTDVQELNICIEQDIRNFVLNNKCNYIINCAAYTAVDKAETDQETAYTINSKAPELLAKICSETNIKFIQISTDYVFDGTNHTPYIETDTVNPQSIYGKSKLDGEIKASQQNPNTCIIRTSWLYSTFGNNFVKTMIRLGSEREKLTVIFDQIGTPTYARDLAQSIIQIISNVESNSVEFTPGIFHYSNEGVCSWYDFSKEIFDLTKINCTAIPIETKDYPSPTKRPHYSVLNKTKIKSTYNITIPHWKDSLKDCIIKLKIK